MKIIALIVLIGLSPVVVFSHGLHDDDANVSSYNWIYENGIYSDIGEILENYPYSADDGAVMYGVLHVNTQEKFDRLIEYATDRSNPNLLREAAFSISSFASLLRGFDIDAEKIKAFILESSQESRFVDQLGFARGAATLLTRSEGVGALEFFAKVTRPGFWKDRLHQPIPEPWNEESAESAMAENLIYTMGRIPGEETVEVLNRLKEEWGDDARVQKGILEGLNITEIEMAGQARWFELYRQLSQDEGVTRE